MVGPAKKRQRREDKSAAAGDLPQKKFYRQRAHANPFSDHQLTYPESPAAMDWSSYYPAFVDASAPASPAVPRRLTQAIEIADVGCGFGGLLFALAPQFPQTLILGLEIRVSVTEFVTEKITALRTQHARQQQQPATLPSPPDPRPPIEASTLHASPELSPPPQHSYANVATLRANTMKFLPNFFRRGQLTKLFLCFPDPHFKARKHKARIVSAGLAAEYAFVLRAGVGRVYTVTDVRDLHEWMVRHFAACPLFARVPDEEAWSGDPCVRMMCEATEEGKKVARNGGTKYVAVFQRLEDPEWP